MKESWASAETMLFFYISLFCFVQKIEWKLKQLQIIRLLGRSIWSRQQKSRGPWEVHKESPFGFLQPYSGSLYYLSTQSSLVYSSCITINCLILLKLTCNNLVRDLLHYSMCQGLFASGLSFIFYNAFSFPWKSVSLFLLSFPLFFWHWHKCLG